MKKVLLEQLFNDKRFDRKGKCFFFFYRTMSELDILHALNKLEKERM